MSVDLATQKYLEEVQQGKARKFAMICNGAKILSLIVYKSGAEEKYKKQTEQDGKGQFYGGVVTGNGMNITFQLQRDRYDKPPGKEQVLKEFLKTSTRLKSVPTYEIVDSLAGVDDDEGMSDETLTAAPHTVQPGGGPKAGDTAHPQLDSLPAATRVSSEAIMLQMALPIALVGNGPVTQEYGELIDRHATVIRCNNFRISGYECQIGGRTTHWCIHGIVDAAYSLPPWRRMLSQFSGRRRVEGIIPNPHVDENVISYCTKAFDCLLVRRFKKSLSMDLPSIEDASLLYPIVEPIPFATLGFSAAYLLLQFQPRISVFGFTGLKGGHYWSKTHRHLASHKTHASRELDLIQACKRIDFHE